MNIRIRLREAIDQRERAGCKHWTKPSEKKEIDGTKIFMSAVECNQQS